MANTIFCAGYVQLADGRVLVAGGNNPGAGRHRADPHLRLAYRDRTRGPNMNAARWYPSVAALANGRR